jgi:reverse gyrase
MYSYRLNEEEYLSLWKTQIEKVTDYIIKTQSEKYGTLYTSLRRCIRCGNFYHKEHPRQKLCERCRPRSKTKEQRKNQEVYNQYKLAKQKGKAKTWKDFWKERKKGSIAPNHDAMVV